MATINYSDKIFATVMRQGRTIISLQMSGLTSFSELLKNLRRSISKPLGLVTLNLRNSSQGWTQQHTLMFDPSTSKTPSTLQLTLF